MYKVGKNLLPPHVNELFEVRHENPYSLKENSQFSRPLVKLVYHGTEKLSYLGPKVWDILPNIYKNTDGLDKFKKAGHSLRRICKKYITNVDLKLILVVVI